MRDYAFFGFNGLKDLVVTIEQIAPAELAIQLGLNPFKDVKDYLENARHPLFIPVDTSDFTQIELDILSICQNYNHISGSLLENYIVSEDLLEEKKEAIASIIKVLDQLPVLNVIDFLTFLVSRYCSHHMGQLFVLDLLKFYDTYTKPLYNKLIPSLYVCLNGMIDICLINGPQHCFQYYYFQAIAITRAWVEIMRPHLKLEKLRGLEPYNACSILFNLWSYHLDNCRKILNYDVCYNLWLSLVDILPCNESQSINTIFYQVLATLQRAMFVYHDHLTMEHSFTDDLGTNMLFGDEVCSVNNRSAYWREVQELIYENNHTIIKFTDSHHVDLIVSDLITSQELRKHLSSLVYRGLYKRWCGSLSHNLPIRFGDFTIRNDCLEYANQRYPWHQVRLEDVYKDKAYVTFMHTLTNQIFACVDLVAYPNACMLHPLKDAVQYYKNHRLTSFFNAWVKLTPHYVINLDIPDNNQYLNNLIYHALDLAKTEGIPPQYRPS